MLVLSRKENESILIGDEIRIVLLEIRGDRARLGIEAPRDVPVYRREVYDAIQGRSKETAGHSAVMDVALEAPATDGVSCGSVAQPLEKV